MLRNATDHIKRDGSVLLSKLPSGLGMRRKRSKEQRKRLMRTARSSCGSSSKPILLSLTFATCFSALRRLEDLEVRSAPVGVVSSSLERTEDGILPSLPSAHNNAALSLVLLMLFQSIFTSSTSGVVELELWQLLLFCWLLSLLTLACSTNSNNNFGNVASSLQLSSLTANSFNRARFSSNMAVNLSMSKLFLPLKPNTI
uniref:Uncharacterized protein n=1 Tax=Glossina pallidipes TaxID=7398 RepID=A0A1A9ZQR9_GLOPL